MTLQTPPETGTAINAAAPDEARALVDFWRDAGPEMWFAKDPAFDVEFRDRFAAAYCRAAQGALNTWTVSAEGALALVLLLDQYPRNSFRGTPWMYATDSMARLVAEQALALGHWSRVPADVAMFLLLPFGHSERLEDQERSVTLAEAFVPESAQHARHHRDVVRRFGRFPHRNTILGHTTTPEEAAYLADGGYSG
jgi:uncharacterized protein (DUF924 family)